MVAHAFNPSTWEAEEGGSLMEEGHWLNKETALALIGQKIR